jgi:predicted RND superfamily exporter protein
VSEAEAGRAPRDPFAPANRWLGALGAWCAGQRFAVLALGALFAGACLWLAGGARIDNSFDNFFDKSDPAYRAYLQYREDFGSDEIAYLLYEAPGREHGVFDLEVMRKIAQLTRELEREVPFVYEVTSLANAEIVEGVAEGLEIYDLLEDFPETQQELLARRELVLAKPMYVDGIVSRDGRWGAIVVDMARSSTDAIEDIQLDPAGGEGLDNLYPQPTQAKIDEILARPDYRDLVFHVSGDVPLNAAWNWIITGESRTLDLATLAVIAVLLFAFFRSPLAVIGPLVVVQISVVAAVAFVALVGWNVDMMFGNVPTLVITVGVAEAVHILAEWRTQSALHSDRRAVARRTLELVGVPCLLTSLTSAAGFLSMGLAPVASIARMSVYSAVGVMVAFVLSMTLLVAFLALGRPRGPVGERELALAKGGARMQGALLAVARLAVRRRRELLAVSALVCAAAAAGIARLEVDSNWLDDLSDRVPIKAATLTIDETMGGLNSLVYLFDSGEPEGVKDPAVLRDIERVQRDAERHAIVEKTYSVVDVLKDLNQAFHEGDSAHYRIPESRELVAQYLLLYEGSGGDEVEEFISSDFARASLEIRTRLTKTSLMAKLADDIDAAIAAQPLAASSAARTGIGELWLQLLDYIVVSQVQGVILAFVSIAAMMCVVCRSLRTALLAMIPNVAPVLVTLGAMGWLGLPLDYNKLMIASVAIGIAVDDTIHFVTRFHREFRERGSYARALEAALSDVGRAVFITSVTLVCGFLVLLLSVMASRVLFGWLLAATIATALLAEFFLMPALLLSVKPFGPEDARATRGGVAALPPRAAA